MGMIAAVMSQPRALLQRESKFKYLNLMIRLYYVALFYVCVIFFYLCLCCVVMWGYCMYCICLVHVNVCYVILLCLTFMLMLCYIILFGCCISVLFCVALYDLLMLYVCIISLYLMLHCIFSVMYCVFLQMFMTYKIHVSPLAPWRQISWKFAEKPKQEIRYYNVSMPYSPHTPVFPKLLLFLISFLSVLLRLVGGPPLRWSCCTQTVTPPLTQPPQTSPVRCCR